MEACRDFTSMQRACMRWMQEGCRGRYKCRLATTQCTALCHCGGFAMNEKLVCT